VRVVVIAPPWYPVPPAGYGGIELVVALEARELQDRGHDVTVIASGGSDVDAALLAPLPEPPPAGTVGNGFCEAFHASRPTHASTRGVIRAQRGSLDDSVTGHVLSASTSVVFGLSDPMIGRPSLAEGRDRGGARRGGFGAESLVRCVGGRSHGDDVCSRAPGARFVARSLWQRGSAHVSTRVPRDVEFAAYAQ
jgi:hypothetical protein